MVICSASPSVSPPFVCKGRLPLCHLRVLQNGFTEGALSKIWRGNQNGKKQTLAADRARHFRGFMRPCAADRLNHRVAVLTLRLTSDLRAIANMATPVVLNLRQAVQAIEASYARQKPPTTLPRLAILRHIARAGSVMQTDIVRATGIDRSTLSALLEKMNKDRLVKVERGSGDPGDDARVVTVWITAGGLRVLAAAENCLFIAEKAVVGEMSRSDLDAAARFGEAARKVQAPSKRTRRVRHRLSAVG